MKRLLIALAVIALLSPIAYLRSQQWLPGAQGVPIVCAYSTSPPTVASGLFAYVNCNTNGELITSSGGGSFTWPGSAAVTNYGTAPTGTVPAVNAFVTNSPAGTVSNASSGVATSSTNTGAVSWLYGFNGTTWDQLRSTGTPNFSLSVDVPTTNNNIYTALTAPIAAQSTHTVNIGAVDSISPYPATAVPITASATGTTAATTATLTAVSGHTTYICGLSIRANATAAATNNATVTGTISGTLNFTQWTAPLASGLGVTEEAFVPCIPASAVTTSIAVISGAPGSGGVVSVTAWGYSI